MGIQLERRFFTQDRAESATEVFTTNQLSPRMSMTPEGFLLCQDVAIARVGEMVYGPHETPIDVGSDGRAYITRDSTALFSPSTIASYQGKPVVNEHPDVDVTPENWKQFAVGLVLNPRAGVGDDADVMLGDLLIMEAQAIRDVKANKREVSAGYEADYEPTGKGRGRQTNIIGNHVALVERGRCGPRCAINDHQPNSLKEHTMATKNRRTVSAAVKDAVRRAFKDAENEALEQLGNSGIPDGDEPGEEPDGDETGGHTHIHIHSGGEAGAPPAPAGAPAAPDAPADGAPADPMEARIAALESQMGQILAILQGGDDGGQPAGDEPPAAAPTEGDPTQDEGLEDLPDGAGDDGGAMTKDAARKSTTDSAALETSFRQLLSDAEVIYPGFRLPTFDHKLPRQKTVDSMCALRRQVLHSAYLTADGKNLIDSVAGQTDINFGKQDCAQTAVLFRAAAGAKKMLNNRSSVGDAHRVPVTQQKAGAVSSIADINARNKAFWASQGKK